MTNQWKVSVLHAIMNNNLTNHSKHLTNKKDTNHVMELRNPEVYKANHANTEQCKSSAVPYMQRLLNKFEEK